MEPASLIRPCLALALVVAAGAFAQSDLDALRDPVAPAGLIAFVDPDGHLAVVDPASAAVRTFGGGLERAQFPAWSADGDRVAAVVAGQAGGRVDVVDVAAGGEPVTVYARPAHGPIYLSWAPDGRRLAVLAGTQGGALALDLVEVTAALAGDPDAVRPFSTGAPFYWTWAHDGASLLVHRDVMRPNAVVGFTSADAFDVARPLADPGAFQAPAISSSGRFVAYARRGDGGRSVVALPNPERPDAFGEPRILAYRGTVALAWRPGAEQLAAQRSVPPGAQPHGPVDLVDMATGDVRRLSDDTVLASFWSPDGRHLATLSVVGGGTDRTVVADAHDGASGAFISALPAQARLPTLTLKVVDAETAASRVLGLFTPSPLFFAQYLPFFDQYARSHRLWSPASDALVVPALDELGVPTLVRFGLDGEVRPLVPGDMPAWNVR